MGGSKIGLTGEAKARSLITYHYGGRAGILGLSKVYLWETSSVIDSEDAR